MKLPWVSRRHYDAVVRMQDVMIERQRVELDSLAARYHMLKLQGFAAPSPTPAPLPVPAIDPVEAAIVRRSGGNVQLADQMRSAAALDRASGIDDTVIVQRIYMGTRIDERVTL